MYYNNRSKGLTGLDINSNIINNRNAISARVDAQALARVKEQILNPQGEKNVDVSKLNLDKFNRVSLGTDLYAQRTNGEVALQASKAATDFGIDFSKQFNANVQMLNSFAAQAYANNQDLSGKVIAIDVANQVVNEKDTLIAATQTSGTQDLKKDRRGANPFSFYAKQDKNEVDEKEATLFSKNIFA